MNNDDKDIENITNEELKQEIDNLIIDLSKKIDKEKSSIIKEYLYVYYNFYLNLTEETLKDILFNDDSSKIQTVLNIKPKFSSEFEDELEDVEDYLSYTSDGVLQRIYGKIQEINDIISKKIAKKVRMYTETFEPTDIMKMIKKYNIDSFYPKNTKGYKTYPKSLLKKTNAEFARKLIAECGVVAIEHIPDEIFDELDQKDFMEILRKKDEFSPTYNPKKGILDKLSIYKRQKIINSIGLINLLKMIPEFNYFLIYEAVDEISEADFNAILLNGLYSGIELNKSVRKNKDYVNRLINIGYKAIILSLDDEDITDEMLNILNDTKEQIVVNKDRKFITSDKIVNYVTDSGSKYLYAIVSPDKLDIETVLKFILHMDCYRGLDDLYFLPKDIIYDIFPYIDRNNEFSVNEKGIKYLIDRGYDFTNLKVKRASELKILVTNGYPNLIDIAECYVDTSIVDLAIKHGYKINSKYANNKYDLNDITYPHLKKYYELFIKKIYSIRKSGLSKDPCIEIYINNCIKEKGYDNFYDYIDGIGAGEKLRNFLLTWSQLSQDDIDYLTKKYQNNPRMLNYINIVGSGVFDHDYDWLNNINITEYIDEFGPKKELYELLAFTNFSLVSDMTWYSEKELKCLEKYKVFSNEVYHTIQTENPDYFNQYIYNKCQGKVEEIFTYFNELGPTQKLLNEALYNPNLFKIMYNHNIINEYNEVGVYDSIKEDYKIVSYINFASKTKCKICNIVKSYEDIEKYFDEFGPKKVLYDILLFDKDLFDMLYKDDKVLEYYKDDLSILTYMKFIKEYGIEFQTIICSLDDIHKYFNEFGPTKKLYNEVLFNEKLFPKLFNKEGSYKEYYNYDEISSIATYIKFQEKYGDILKNIIGSYDDIIKCFNKDGATPELKRIFKENPKMADALLIDLSHDEVILVELDKSLIDVFEYYLIDKYFKKCQNPQEQYDYLLKNIGPEILFSFDNKNIEKIINYDRETLEKFFNLFKNNSKILSSHDTYNNITVSLLNYVFKKEHKDIVEVFTNINSIINQLNQETLNDYLNGKNSSDTEPLNEWVKRIVKELSLSNEQIEVLKQAIIECKKLNEVPLRKICRTYLESCEKNYELKNKNIILMRFGILPEYELKDKAIAYANYTLKELNYNSFKIMLKELYDKFNDKSIKGYEKLLEITEEQFNLLIKISKNNGKPDEAMQQKIKELGPIYSAFKKFIMKVSNYKIENNLVSEEKLKRLDFTNVQPAIKLEKIDMLKIITEMDVDVFKDYANEHPEILESLAKTISSYGLGRLPESIAEVFNEEYSLILPDGINNIGMFITKYQQLIENKRKSLLRQGKNVKISDIHLTFTEVVELISIVNGETYELRRLLGKNEYYDFSANKGANKANYDRITRENKLASIVDYLYILDGVTIPSHDMIIESTSGKKINFIVGNRTNPANVCHGERTDACMRVGGVGEGLFLKCLTDKNWFHIRIEDPITHEYVSRVSGFRNGNTVYLNQLREPQACSNYTNQDLQEFIRIYAQKLIEETKNSEYPIENVFINDDYAMSDSNGTVLQLGNDIQKEYNLNDVLDLRLCDSTNIWTDVRTRAILLATTEEGQKTKDGYVPIKNGPENAEIYPPVRDKIYGLEYGESKFEKHRFVVIEQEELREKINRVHAMKEKLLGKDYMFNITDELYEDTIILDAYASSDWFVYLDENNQIHSEYISQIGTEKGIIPYHQESQAKEEMEYYTELLIKKYNLKEQMTHAI